MATTLAPGDAPASWHVLVTSAQNRNNFPLLVRLIQRNPGCVRVLVACVGALLSLVVKGNADERLVFRVDDTAFADTSTVAIDADAVDAVLCALTAHRANAQLQRMGWQLLAILLCHVEVGKVAFATYASKIAADALVVHLEHDAGVMVSVCTWLRTCANDEALGSVTAALVRDHIFVRLAAVLGAHVDDVKVLQVALGAVSELSSAYCQDPMYQGCDYFARMGAEDVALASMLVLRGYEEHDKQVERNAIEALATLCQFGTTSMHLSLLDAGFMDVLSDALMRSARMAVPTNEMPLLRLVALMTDTLCQCQRTLPSATCTALMTTVVAGLRRCAEDARVAESWFVALFSLNELCADGGLTLQRAGAVPLLRAALDAYPNEAAIQRCRTLLQPPVRAAMDLASASATADAAMAALLAEEEAERAGKAAQASKRKKKKSKKKRGGASSSVKHDATASCDDDDESAGAADAVAPAAAPDIGASEAAAAPHPPPADVPPPPRRVPPPYRPPVGGASPLALPAPTPSILPPPLAQQCAPLLAPSLAALSLASTASAAAAAPQPLPPPLQLRECCVCLADVMAADLLLLLPCAHRCVCQTCADELIAQHRGCPKCREPIARALRVFED